MPRSTIERCSSGSWTGRRASTIWLHGGGDRPSVHCGDGGRHSAEFALRAIGRIRDRYNVDRTAPEPGVHRHRVGDHRRLRRPDAPPIYLFARDHPVAAAEGVTASAVAAEVGVHPNVARHHLDKLAAGGYSRSSISGRRRPGAGPVVRRSATSPSPMRAMSMSTSRCAATISCWRCSAGRSTACPTTRPRRWPRRSAHEYGRAMAAGLTGDALAAGQRSLRSAMQAVADALTAHGFAAHAESRQRPAADHQRPLPVRHGRHRPPGDLRRRPRHGQAGCSSALVDVDGDDSATSPPSRARPAATRSAPPPSDHPRSAHP